TLNHGFESVVELLRRLADSEPAVNFEYRNPSGFADVDFHGQPVSHGGASVYPELRRRWLFARPDGIIRWRVSCTKRTVPRVYRPNRPSLRKAAYQKNKSTQ